MCCIFKDELFIRVTSLRIPAICRCRAANRVRIVVNGVNYQVFELFFQSICGNVSTVP